MSTILFYDREHGAAALADLSPHALTTLHSFAQGSFGNWTHVTSQGATSLFYRRDDGSAAIGTVAGGTFSTTKSYAAGSFANWTHIVATAAGLLFYSQMNGSAAVGSLRSSGLVTTGTLGGGSLSEWTHIVANGSTVLFYNRLNGAAAIAAITSSGLTTATSYQPGSFGSWTHVVNDGANVLFYNRDTGSGAVGTLSQNSFTTTAAFNAGSFGVWTHLSTSGSTVLFYNRDSGSAAIGTLTAKGFSTTTIYQGGQLSRWTHVTGTSAGGPEENEMKVAVLLCHWQRPPATSTVLTQEFYRRHLFDLSAPDGLGRYWFDQSGGRLRLTGEVRDWISLSKAPSDPSINADRTALCKLAIADAKAAGWKPGNVQAIVIFVACDGAAGVNAGATGDPIAVDGIDRAVAVLHADSANWIAKSFNNVANFRFDFNAHEVGHTIGEAYAFSHAFGPNGVYDNGYCIMAAMRYGSLGNSVLYDPWSASSKRPPEQYTKGPGLAGVTRSACGWARARSVAQAEVHDVATLYLAHLGDHDSCLPQVLEFPVTTAGNGFAVYAIEFRSPLDEHDQSISPTLVLSQREGSAWSSNATYRKRSSTFRAAAPVGGQSLPTLIEEGVVRVQVIEVAAAVSRNGRVGPPWIRVRLSQ